MIHLGGQNGRILAGDSHDVAVLIDVSLDHQLPRPFVDGAKVTWLFGLSETQNRELMAMLATNANVSGRIPIGPPCGRLLNQIDVLALRILSCAEKKHGC